ncbi:MAG: ypmQ 2 [Gemmatimonadetes bacterium]|nr:ypmQ 2 [Gemmatimonadota bacterium]
MERARQERDLASRSATVHDFRFVNRVEQSGIDFENRIVDDAGKSYKAVHYDHGSGLAAADVDGDGRPDLYFVTQLGTSQLWKNLGGGKFANITESAGLVMNDAIGVGASFADIDNDGDPDLFVTTVRHGNRLFENLGGGKFRDITAQAGVGYSGHSSGAVFFDYDGDGKLDLFVANVGTYTGNEKGPGGYYVGLEDAFHGHTHPDRAEASILYHNEGGNKFREVTKQAGLVDKSWSGDAVVMDINNDGFPDLYVLDMQGENHLWLNVRGTSFRDATKDFFPKTPWGAMGAKVFDFNGDGKLDLYITDMHSDMFTDIQQGNWTAETSKSDPTPMPAELFPGGKTQFIFGNALFVNGGGRFDEVSDRMGVETYWPWGPSVDDLNADGWDDIFVAGSMNFPFRYSVNSVLLNEAGKHFLPSEFTLGVEPRANGSTLWFTLDCEGADRGVKACGVCSSEAAASQGCASTGKPGQFTVNGSRGTRSAIIVDVDGDGALDIVTNEFNTKPMLLMSDLARKHSVHSLTVKLKGTTSNRSGIGAKITVVLPDHRRVVKMQDGKSGYLSQSDLPVYFGLGAFDHADAIEVEWPSHKHQTMAGPIRAGHLVEIIEP